LCGAHFGVAKAQPARASASWSNGSGNGGDNGSSKGNGGDNGNARQAMCYAGCVARANR